MKTSSRNLLTSILVTTLAALTPLARAQISASISINIAPPALPVYAQPAIPSDGYLWTPGYWSWNPSANDYYWVPGTWVNAPYVGALWTPGYWGYVDNQYTWNRGYWGDHIGYYGGINYGFGYAGVGYQGGYWDHGAFSYNRSVNNVSNVHITNVYNARITNVQNSHASFNGGKGGVQMTATKSDELINKMPHNQATPQQAQHEAAAATRPGQRLSANHGAPKVAATPEPGKFDSPKTEPSRPEQPAHAAHTPARVAQAHPSEPKPAQQRPAPARPESNQAAHPAAAPHEQNRSAPMRTEEHK